MNADKQNELDCLLYDLDSMYEQSQQLNVIQYISIFCPISSKDQASDKDCLEGVGY